MIERSDRLDRILDQRRSDEERCHARVCAIRRMISARAQRLSELEAKLITCAKREERSQHAGDLVAADRFAKRLRHRAGELRTDLQADHKRLNEALAELAAAGRRRLAVERLLTARTVDEQRRAFDSAQAELDDHGRLRLLEGE